MSHNGRSRTCVQMWFHIPLNMLQLFQNIKQLFVHDLNRDLSCLLNTCQIYCVYIHNDSIFLSIHRLCVEKQNVALASLVTLLSVFFLKRQLWKENTHIWHFLLNFPQRIFACLNTL